MIDKKHKLSLHEKYGGYHFLCNSIKGFPELWSDTLDCLNDGFLPTTDGYNRLDVSDSLANVVELLLNDGIYDFYCSFVCDEIRAEVKDLVEMGELEMSPKDFLLILHNKLVMHYPDSEELDNILKLINGDY